MSLLSQMLAEANNAIDCNSCDEIEINDFGRFVRSMLPTTKGKGLKEPTFFQKRFGGVERLPRPGTKARTFYDALVSMGGKGSVPQISPVIGLTLLQCRMAARILEALSCIENTGETYKVNGRKNIVYEVILYDSAGRRSVVGGDPSFGNEEDEDL